MSRTRIHFLVLSLTVLLAAAPAAARDREFHEIVNRVADAYHKRPMRMMGLVSFVARPFMPAGVSGFKLAVFDGVDPALQPNGGDFDGFMQGVAGPSYHPFVRVHSKRDGEQTYIYLREAKDASEMLIVTLDASDAVVLKVRVKPEAMKEWMDDPVGQGRSSAHHGQDIESN